MILFNRNDSLISDLLTPTGGSNLTFKVSFDFIFFYICDPGLEHKTSLMKNPCEKEMCLIAFTSQSYF